MKSEAETHSQIVSIYLYGIFFVYAFSATIIGPLMPELLRHYDLSYSGGGLLVGVRSVGGVATMLIGGVLSDRLPKFSLIIGAFLIFGLGLLAAGRAPAVGLMYVLFFGLGASSRYMDMVANAYVADLRPETKERGLSLLHGFFGLGALLGPIYARVVIARTDQWPRVYTILSLVCLAALLPGLVLARRAPRQDSSRAIRTKFTAILRSPSVWLLAGALGLYVAHQSGLTVWLPLYMESELGTGPWLASGALSMLWVGIVLGRFTSSVVTRRFTPRQLLITGHIAGGVLLGCAVLMRAPLVLAGGVALAGLTTGAAYPLIVALACEKHPGSTGAVTSVLFITGTGARILVPWLIGLGGNTYGLMPGILLTGLVLIGAAGLVALSDRSTSHPPA